MKKAPYKQKFDDCRMCVHSEEFSHCRRHHFCKAGEFFKEKIEEVGDEPRFEPRSRKRDDDE